MKFLALEERIQLQEILIKNSYLKATDADSRLALLETCDLGECSALVDLNKPLAIFIQELCYHLSKKYIEVGTSKRLGLIILLEYIIQSNFIFQITDIEETFIKSVIQKWEASESSPSAQRRNNIKTLMASRQLCQSGQTVQSKVKVDRSIIINFDLNTLIAKFVESIKYQGAFSFAVGGNAVLLQQYIIERICRQLEQITERKNQQYNLQLYKTNIFDCTDMESAFLSQCKIESFINLFDVQIDTNILIVIWNYDIPKKVMQSSAQSFWTQLCSHLSPILVSQGRCLVLIWANVDKAPISGFTVLPTPKQFDLIELLVWFRNRLKQEGVAEAQIEDCLNRLNNQGGHLVGTYLEMDRIIRDLQGGYRLYG